jgi:hypothetical protein
MRSHLVVSLALAAVSVAACNVPESSFGPDFCLPLDGPCTPSPGGTASVVTYWIAGLPADRISTSVGATEELIPGDSITLHLVSGTTGPSSPSDTVRTVNWAVTNGAVARVTAGQGGSGALVAIAPGNFSLTANGGAALMFACGPLGCTMITNIRVVAPPAPSVR